MKCYMHNDQDAVGVCTFCGKSVCSTCAVQLGGKLQCKSCVEKALNMKLNSPITLEAETRIGRLIFVDGKIVLDYPDTTKLVNNILPFKGNHDYIINISDIQKVEYTPGTTGIIVPHIKIYHGKNQPRMVTFQRRGTDHQKGVRELTKVVEEMKKLGINTVLI